MLPGGTRRKKPRAGAAQRATPEEQAVSSRQVWQRRLTIGMAFVVLVFAVTPSLTPERETGEEEIDFEAIPQDDIYTDVRLTSVDTEATKQAKEQAAAQVPRRYYIDTNRVEDLLTRFETRVETVASAREDVDKAIRDALRASTSEQDPQQVVKDALVEFAKTYEAFSREPFSGLGDPSKLAAWLTPAPECIPERLFEAVPEGEAPTGPLPVKSLESPGVSPLVFANLGLLTDLSRSALEYTLAYGVLDASEIKGEEASELSIVILRDSPVGDQKDTEIFGLMEVPVPAIARQRLLLERVSATAEAVSTEEPDTPRNWEELQAAAYEMAKSSVDHTLAYDDAATVAAKETARGQVENVPRIIQRSKMIQERRQAWTEQSIADYEAWMALKSSGQEPAVGMLGLLVGHMALVGLILACLVRSLSLMVEKPRDPYANLPPIMLIMCSTVVLGWVVLYVDPTGMAGLVVPVAACAILLAILTNARLAAWVAFLTAALVSIQHDYDWRLLLVHCAMSFAGVIGIVVVRRRSVINSAVFKAALAGVAALAAITLTDGSLWSEEIVRQFLFIGMNGIAALVIVLASLNVLERLFKITTDMQLLEYSDLNNEVLSRLSIEIPATYAHSRMLGDLAEAAAVRIGANGLLARVCAYYHDIGKLRRPEYFAENQTGVNVHDDLSPRLSARAISAHVAEGVEMAREFHLPEPVIDGINEHHGTCLISFFYQQAKAKQKHGDVSEDDFRYAGPKPQSRETAILMICDASESACRSIKHPNEERIREMVDRIVKTRADDGQFDECDLTLKDLDIIKDVVAQRVLISLHVRISYPDTFPEKKEPPRVIPMSGGGEL